MERWTPNKSLAAAAALVVGLTVLLFAHPKLRSGLSFWLSPEDRMMGRAVADFNASLSSHDVAQGATSEDCDFLDFRGGHHLGFVVACAMRVSNTLTATGNYMFGDDFLFDNTIFETQAAPQETN